MSLAPYLESTTVIDWTEPEVLALAGSLSAGNKDSMTVARRCFEWVRDEVRHSMDFHVEAVACSASETLRLRTGLCYAKSHLLAGLLRANGIPAALSYQRLLLSDQPASGFCLHGLVAVQLPGIGWHRIDPRGNKPGVSTAFTPPVEKLAYAPQHPGERDVPERYAQPLPQVVDALMRYRRTSELVQHLPDLP